ncbi:MAG: CsgG/HfaB family protein [Synergistaceae bacterium]|jgi:curli biogenesis system outer membrane secretion channel CsgG|nr:CsgG/HfaB family protein [Synergistaceae bacterium]
MKMWKIISIAFCFSVSIFMVTADAAVGDKIRIGILSFESKAKDISKEQANTITDIFTYLLSQSRTLAVFERNQLAAIGREQKLGASGLIDPNTAVKIGKLVGLQYILLGSVTQLDKRGSVAGAYGIVVGSEQTTATIDMRIIDVETSEVAVALRANGSSKNDIFGIVFNEHASYMNANFSGAEQRAIVDAVNKLGHDVKSALGDEVSHVIDVTSDGITLDIAAAGEGSLFLIYAEGKEIIDLEGNVVGRNKTPIAVVKVRDVNVGHSIADVVPNGGDKNLVRRGDGAEPISPEKAKQLFGGKKFAKSRPKGQSGTFETFLANENVSPSAPAREPQHASNFDRAETKLAAPASASRSPVPSSAVSSRSFENVSTDPAKVIPTYGLAGGEANTRRIAHLGAQKLSGKKAYDKYVELAQSYSGDYLAAYQAGKFAQQMKQKDGARSWYEKSLAINPEYRPAQDALKKIK